VSIESLMALGMITVFVNVMTKGSRQIMGLEALDCDEKECKNCGKKGMEYPQMFDDPEK